VFKFVKVSSFYFQNFGNRLQTQNIFLDFLDEPLDSLRRRREGMYVSYTFGQGDKAVKVNKHIYDIRLSQSPFQRCRFYFARFLFTRPIMKPGKILRRTCGKSYRNYNGITHYIIGVTLDKFNKGFPYNSRGCGKERRGAFFLS
jgi:hypothetical protein